MAKQSRKVSRAQSQQLSGKERRAQLRAPLATGEAPAMPDPLAPEQMRATLLRVGLIVGALWLVGALIAGVSNTRWVSTTALVVPAVLTVLVIGVMIWTIRRTNRAREMQTLLAGVQTDEDRLAALQKLELSGKKSDPTAIFAKAQLEMQQDPKQALATLETIDLSRVMAPVADEARAQRAMIHLTLGQVSLARQLVDNIDPKRQQDLRSKAMIAAISGEAWARSGEAQKALTTLEAYDPNDEQFVQLRPQLLRSLAFAQAYGNKGKELKQTLRAMMKIDARLLGAFLQGKGHPILQKEAKRLL
ncbi:MAG TPA: hypothetical protein VLC09_14740, partial [Polyangiaceae bacterium]|nr:hypothetical protein [Polyangiaceae bacterium]